MYSRRLWLSAIIVVIVVGVVGYFWFGTGSSDLDAQRRSDVRNLQQALDGYFKDHGAYPATPASVDCQTGYNNVGNLSDSLVPKYITTIPKDPNPASCQYNYWYWSDKKGYIIMVHMDNIDPATYLGYWCIGASAGPPPSMVKGYLPCP
jgi:type II secretory pathway pseudopilin PulG